MCICMLQHASDLEADTLTKSKLAEARRRLLTMEKEQLEIPEINLKPVGIRELFDSIYSRR